MNKYLFKKLPPSIPRVIDYFINLSASPARRAQRRSQKRRYRSNRRYGLTTHDLKAWLETERRGRKGDCFLSIDRLLVVGAGQMGSGIAQVAAQTGLEVALADVSMDYAQKGVERIARNLSRQVEKGRMTEADKTGAMSRVKCVSDYSAGKDVDLVIEAIVEDPDVKSKLFAELASICPPEVIFASNTSSVSITAMARDSGRPERFIGMHFMNPVPVMKLVEVVRGLATSDKTCNAIVDLAKRMGKEPVVVADSPAFVVNRLAIPMINEAIFALSEGISSAEGIDTCVKLGLNHPMGPLALADLIGLDTVLSILEVMFKETGDPKYRPCPLLRRMVAAGRLGRKSGLGFYEYS